MERDANKDVIKIEYTLSNNELTRHFTNITTFRTKGKIRVAQTVLLVLFIIYKLADMLFGDFDYFSLALVLAAAAVVAAMWAVPEHFIRKDVEEFTKGGCSFTVYIHKDKIEVHRDSLHCDIMLNSNTRVMEKGELIFIWSGQMASGVIIPTRAIKQEQLQKVRNIIGKYKV